MKLSAARAPDFNDMISLWPRCTFVDAVDVVDQFYDAFPNEEPDPFLSNHVQTIIDAATGS